MEEVYKIIQGKSVTNSKSSKLPDQQCHTFFLSFSAQDVNITLLVIVIFWVEGHVFG